MRRLNGVIGFLSGAFGVAGWEDDARVWAGWAKVNPELAGVLVGAGGVMVLTWIVLEIAAWRKRKTTPEVLSQPMMPTINVTQTVITGTPDTGRPFVYDPHDRTVSFGTVHGDMRIRFHDAETIMDDIHKWLGETGQRGPVSPEWIRQVLLKAGKDRG